MMNAGNAEIQADIVHLIAQRFDRFKGKHRIRDFAQAYLELLNDAKKTIATNQLLSSFGLTADTFISRQLEMNDRFVDRLTSAIFQVETGCETIIAGLDDTGPHLYKIDDSGLRCCDAVGFAAIGYGARHAESQFMLGEHIRASSLIDTAMLTYIAKKRSEIAPGVGQDTDLFYIRHSLQHVVPIVWLFQPEVITPFQTIYDQLKSEQDTALEKAKEALRKHVASLTPANQKPNPATELLPPNPKDDQKP